MRIETTYDELLHAATVGLEPDESDLARVRVPVGEDVAAFNANARAVARQIAAAQRNGLNGEARALAERAKAEYDAAFASLQPIPAGSEPEPVEAIADRMFRRY